mmetsp:Transcript_49/g.102  ORF Transcript_49/g.102 Transcript_49/m.102 type:complete len:281 (-) Transcript_49:2394-3236(-)
MESPRPCRSLRTCHGRAIRTLPTFAQKVSRSGDHGEDAAAQIRHRALLAPSTGKAADSKEHRRHHFVHDAARKFALGGDGSRHLVFLGRIASLGLGCIGCRWATAHGQTQTTIRKTDEIASDAIHIPVLRCRVRRGRKEFGRRSPSRTRTAVQNRSPEAAGRNQAQRSEYLRCRISSVRHDHSWIRSIDFVHRRLVVANGANRIGAILQARCQWMLHHDRLGPSVRCGIVGCLSMQPNARNFGPRDCIMQRQSGRYPVRTNWFVGRWPCVSDIVRAGNGW